jgi:hypothetical protein
MAQNIFARNKGWTAFGVVVVIAAVVGIGEIRQLTLNFPYDFNEFQFSAWFSRDLPMMKNKTT